ncbi:hypothetical protein [Streptomyces sp. 8N706]|uniref:hypothetical protein n=1 Tax=Streptomyces sp. 8N706 TaxID=3457416 RepID=UPI003FCF107F
MARRPGVRTAAVLPAAVALAVAGGSGSGGRKSGEASGSGNGAQGVNTSRLKIATVTHSGEGDTFWDIVRRGAEQAAAKDNLLAGPALVAEKDAQRLATYTARGTR